MLDSSREEAGLGWDAGRSCSLRLRGSPRRAIVLSWLTQTVFVNKFLQLNPGLEAKQGIDCLNNKRDIGQPAFDTHNRAIAGLCLLRLILLTLSVQDTEHKGV